MSKLLRVVLKEEMVAVTGHPIKAVLLNQFIYWTDILEKADRETEKEMNEYIKLGLNDKAEKKKDQMRFGWFWKSCEELEGEVMGLSSAKTINRLLNELVKDKFLIKGKNPDPKKKWDRTNWYKVDLDFVRSELKKLGYVLDGYAIPDEAKPEEKQSEPALLPISQNEKCISHFEKSNAHSEKCISHSEKTIPEITSEISTKTTVKDSFKSSSSESSKKPKRRAAAKKLDDDEIEKQLISLCFENEPFKTLHRFLLGKAAFTPAQSLKCITFLKDVKQCDSFSEADLESAFSRIGYAESDIEHFFAAAIAKESSQRRANSNRFALAEKRQQAAAADAPEPVFYDWLDPSSGGVS